MKIASNMKAILWNFMSITSRYRNALVVLCLLTIHVDFMRGQKREKVCSKMEIHTYAHNLLKLTNCTVIEGPLIIKSIHGDSTEAFERLSFPDLVEITDYLILYRVHHLKTLRNLFPNLAVIRGHVLVHSYSLIVYSLPHLDELGLIGLTTIVRGSVRFEHNPNLCFLESIDWGIIAEGRLPEEHAINPTDKPECFDICPSDCPATRWNGKLEKRCWTVEECQNCQKVLCAHCPNGLCTDNGRTCCDDYCLGGCTGPGPARCIACRDVIYDGICQPKCPDGTYRFKERRCVTKDQCAKESACYDKEFKVLDRDDEEGQCVEKCPVGYVEVKEDLNRCKKCKGKCPVWCHGLLIDSIEAAQRLTGCTVTDSITISINSGKNTSISKELEKGLSSIEEVNHFIKIRNSYPLVSLDFFKNLRIIHGNTLENNRYALYIYGNQNLKYLFSNETTSRLKIKTGSVLFDYNRKLCLNVINQLLDTIQFNMTTAEKNDLDKANNGDRAQCNIHPIQWLSFKPGRMYCSLQWYEFDEGDPRDLLGYLVFYREATSPTNTMTLTEGRDACQSSWSSQEKNSARNSRSRKGKSKLVKSFTGNLTIFGDKERVMMALLSLKPYTMYVVYVETVMLSSSKIGGITKVLEFRTEPSEPTVPLNLHVTSSKPSELSFSWGLPREENGVVTYYEVFWKTQEVRHKDWYAMKDFCASDLKEDIENKLRKDWQDSVMEEKKKDTVNRSEGCDCESPKGPDTIDKDERRIMQAKKFENNLQGIVYVKRNEVTEVTNLEKKCNKYRNGLNSTRVKRDADPGYALSNNNSTTTLTVSNNDTSTAANVSDTSGGSGPVPDNELPNKVTVTNGTSWTLMDLNYFTVYIIEVMACQQRDSVTNLSYCGPHAFIRVRTEHSHEADRIDESSIIHEKLANGTMLIRWDQPRAPNGIVLRYEVRYRRDSGLDSPAICVSHRSHKEYRGFRLPALGPGNYSYQIRSYTLAKYGPWSSKHYFLIHEKYEGMRTDIMIGLIMAAVVMVILVTIVVVWRIARRRFEMEHERIISSINPEYMLTGEEYIADNWEVARDDIELLKELGQGSFGMVYEGLYTITKDKPSMLVAVKTLNDGADIFSRANFLKEATHMKQFTCTHVVRLKGVVSKTQPTYVIMELMANGDLKNFLRKHRPDEDNPNIYPKQKISCRQVLKMAGEIADGMAYLASKKFVHRDLAARNCMVSQDWIVKIGDFGMTRDIYETDYYRKGGKDLLPVRWMAPESLKDGVYASKSDVWSFGVVLWEMATLAAQPYQGLGNEQVLKFVINGETMECPEGCPEKLFELMMMCWEYRATRRPTFCRIIEMLISDLPPSFKDDSFFFSDENHQELHEPEDFHAVDALNDDDLPATLIKGSDIELDRISVVQASRRQEPMDYQSGAAECAVLQGVDAEPYARQSPPRYPAVLPPVNAVSSTDSSKDSSEGNGYALRNGLINGHVAPLESSHC